MNIEKSGAPESRGGILENFPYKNLLAVAAFVTFLSGCEKADTEFTKSDVEDLIESGQAKYLEQEQFDRLKGELEQYLTRNQKQMSDMVANEVVLTTPTGHVKVSLHINSVGFTYSSDPKSATDTSIERRYVILPSGSNEDTLVYIEGHNLTEFSPEISQQSYFKQYGNKMVLMSSEASWTGSQGYASYTYKLGGEEKIELGDGSTRFTEPREEMAHRVSDNIQRDTISLNWLNEKEVQDR